MKMLPWIKVYWDVLPEEDRKCIAVKSRLIINSSKIDSARATCQDYLAELCQKYKFLYADCASIIDSPTFGYPDLVPCSDIEFLEAYFSQFSSLYPDADNWGKSKQSRGPKRRRFLVRNGFHGDIICELTKETDGSYYFTYIKDGVTVFEDWKVLKRSNRVLEEIFD